MKAVPFWLFDTMLLWGNVMPEEKAGQFLQSKDLKLTKMLEKVVWLCPLCKCRGTEAQSGSGRPASELDPSRVSPGLSASLDMLFIFTVRTHHSAIQPKERRFYTKPKKMKIRAEKQNKWEEAPAELEDAFCASWSGSEKPEHQGSTLTWILKHGR